MAELATVSPTSLFLCELTSKVELVLHIEVFKKLETACAVREETLKLAHAAAISAPSFNPSTIVSETFDRLPLLTKSNASRMT